MRAMERGRARLREKVVRSALNVSGWWGLSRGDAVSALDDARRVLLLADGWPDPAEARVLPSTSDDALASMARCAIDALTAEGKLMTRAAIWMWCKEHGARRRRADALRVLRAVLPSSAMRVPRTR